MNLKQGDNFNSSADQYAVQYLYEKERQEFKDWILQHDSLEKIVRPVLEDENVIAVGGSVRPANGVVIKKRSCDKIQVAQEYNSKNAIPGI